MMNGERKDCLQNDLQQNDYRKSKEEQPQKGTKYTKKCQRPLMI